MLIDHRARWMRFWASGATTSILAMTIAIASPAQVLAQAADQLDSGAGDQSSEGGEDIVVTGTLIRGIAPTGSNVVSLSKDAVAATGATTTTELLATIPQMANMFNTLPQISPGTASTLQVVRPNLRNTPSDNFATGASTLILVDGHRLVNIGVAQVAPDPNTLPPGAIERVEVVTDGGSSTYGADAVGGVINFVTRQRFDGAQVDARYGFADDYYAWDVNAIVGKDWGSGSAYISYTHSQHDNIMGRDRDYAKSIDWNTGIPSGRQCASPNITIGTGAAATSYVVSGGGLAAGGPNTCDPSDDVDLFPSEKQDSVFARLTQNLSDSLKFDVSAYYSRRTSTAVGVPLAMGSTVTVRSPVTNPATGNFYYRNVAADPNANQVISYNYVPAFGRDAFKGTNAFEQWGVTPTFTANLDDNWQLRAMFNYGRSHSSYQADDLNTNALTAAANGTTASTALNPYDIAATNPAILANLRNWERAGDAKDEIINFRLIVDGKLFSLPGGDVRVALGAEHLTENFSFRSAFSTRGAVNSLPYARYNRSVKSLFGELQVPIVGSGNSLPFIHALDLSLAARYDHYSDFGSTFNPKIGVSLKPIEWITLRGNWGKSFNAPTPLDQLGVATSTIAFNSVFFVVPPGTTAPTSGTVNSVAIQGAMPGLKPQTADTWSIGLEVSPPFLAGFRGSISYYHIDYRGTLSKAPITNPTLLFASFPEFITFNPTEAQIRALAAQASNPTAVDPLFVPGALPVFQLIDFRTTNLGNTKLSGLDYSVSYQRPTGFGSVDARIGGNIQLNRKTQASPIAPFLDDLAFGVSTSSFSASLGANIGNLRAQATWNHTAGYRVMRAPNLPQDRVASFNVVNLFFKYDVKGQGLAQDLAFTLNVNNVFDTDPPAYKITGGTGGGIGLSPGYANGATLGRFIQFGASKKF